MFSKMECFLFITWSHVWAGSRISGNTVLGITRNFRWRYVQGFEGFLGGKNYNLHDPVSAFIQTFPILRTVHVYISTCKQGWKEPCVSARKKNGAMLCNCSVHLEKNPKTYTFWDQRLVTTLSKTHNFYIGNCKWTRVKDLLHVSSKKKINCK